MIPELQKNKRFNTTRWSIILAAKSGDDPEARQHALDKLCRTYWYPAYAFLRRNGRSHDDAIQDTQAFFGSLTTADALQHVDPNLGKFRTWLLRSLKNALVSSIRYEQAEMRSKERTDWLDADRAEDRYARETARGLTPEQLYHRAWSLDVLRCAQQSLAEEQVVKGKGELFGAIKGLLVGPEGESPVYEPIAQKLELTVGNLKSIVSRMRQRFGQILREEIRQLCETDEQVDEELAFLLNALTPTPG